jgi:hypothetical protein
MCAAIMLLKVHLGKESWQTAKSACAQRFLDLYYKHIGRQQASLMSQQHPTPQGSLGSTDVGSTNIPALLPLNALNSSESGGRDFAS